MVMQKYVILSFFFLNYLIACQSSSSKESLAESGEVLAKKYCVNCHHPSAGINARMAPPLIQVRDVYMDVYPDADDFVQAISEFVNHPTREKVLMPEAVNKYGLMPRLSYSREKLDAIASYLFEAELSAPEWYSKE